jgi:hypothetical protein
MSRLKRNWGCNQQIMNRMEFTGRSVLALAGVVLQGWQVILPAGLLRKFQK